MQGKTIVPNGCHGVRDLETWQNREAAECEEGIIGVERYTRMSQCSDGVCEARMVPNMIISNFILQEGCASQPGRRKGCLLYIGRLRFAGSSFVSSRYATDVSSQAWAGSRRGV